MEDLNFNIPKADTDRIEILYLVKNNIKDPIKVVGISHKPYLEIYTFTDGNNYADIKIYFNKKHIITSVDNQTDSGITDFGITIKTQLAHIEKKCIISENSSLPIDRLKSISEEINNFVAKLITICQNKNINVFLTNMHDYNFILTFTEASSNRVQYRFNFNSKKVITQIQAINRDQSQIFNTVDNILKDIQNSVNLDNSSENFSPFEEIVDVSIERV